MAKGNRLAAGDDRRVAPAVSGEHPEVEVHGPSSFSRLLMELDDQWPVLRFLGFGFYYAWIWLCYDSGVLIAPSASADGAGFFVNATSVMYLLSTSALALVLLGSAAWERRSAELVERTPFVLLMALVAGLATAVVALRAPFGSSDALFLAASVLTGLGTAWVALRLGAVYAAVSSRRAVMYAAVSFVAAGATYFVVSGLPHAAGIALMSLLPLFAAVCTMASPDESAVCAGERDKAADLPKLPEHFLLRIVFGIALFSIVVGLAKGTSAQSTQAGGTGGVGSIIVLAMSLMALVIYFVVCATGENLDLSRLFYPVILLLVAGLLVPPLLGTGRSLPGSVFVGVAYAFFIMLVWCTLAQIAHHTGMSAVRVFGVGRGASALGTTLGWLIGVFFVGPAGTGEVPLAVTVAMAFVVLMAAPLVFSGRALVTTLEIGPARGAGQDGGDAGDEGPQTDPGPDGACVEPSDDGGDKAGGRHGGAWSRKCNKIADTYALTDREREVLFLLAKGRTISYISDYLHVSFNTSKAHIRHVYIKTGVHTRQELLDLVEHTDA